MMIKPKDIIFSDSLFGPHKNYLYKGNFPQRNSSHFAGNLNVKLFITFPHNWVSETGWSFEKKETL